MSKLTYKDAGVDIREAASLVNGIGVLRSRTEKNRKLHQAFGLFAAAYDLSGYRQPVIVTGCDGVGTKIELLLKYDLLEVAGKDLVAMNVNDVLTTGGDPLLFLDYIGTGHIEKSQLNRLIVGMVDYLESCDCILAGGETAEMPGIVPDGMVELSGFCIGAAEKEDLLDPGLIREGDVFVGYSSDGFHANGWSLVRRVLAEGSARLSDQEMVDLLAPTPLYHDVVAKLRASKVGVKAMAHITGGGLPENLERFLGDKGGNLKIPAWEKGAVSKILAACDPADAIHTFNMGFGWVAIVPADEVESALSCGREARVLGEVRQGAGVRVEVGSA